MKTDEIMRELHAIKDELSAECNYDVEVLFSRLQEVQKSSGRKYVSFCTIEDRAESDREIPPISTGK